ncbi:MAG: hypothetical protein JXB49_25450, partial [Bacteroidales bacterium]|nr:hypothetical protein [Bacteroidales bacterium]
MKVKEFKQKLINYARELIPPGYTDYIRIPGSASTENMNIITTKKDVVRKFFSSEFEQESFAVQFSKNDQVPGLKTIESFEVPLEDNDKEVTDLFPGISEEEFLEEEKQKTKYNFELVMNSQNVSIRKLLDHIEKNQYMGQDISTKDLNHLWDDFLNKWPVERLESMSLNEYTNLNRSDSFCYWLEKKTESLASIWGGSAYKFGIYKRDNLEKEDTRKGYKTDGEYAWVLKFGPDRDSAFQNVRKRVYEVARLAQAGEIEKIDDIDLGHSFKWKIAALYHKNLPFIMKKDAIDYLAEDIGIDTSQPYWVKYNELSNANPGKDILDYSSDLWEKYFKSTQA